VALQRRFTSFWGLLVRKFLTFAFAGLSACAFTPEAIKETHLGIEYATAERWALPSVNSDWDQTGAFDTMGPACPQDGQSVMVEDCLFLNVFTPEAAENSPVLVWFHGGGFRSGSGGDGPKAFTDDGVVVVTFNYRLGRLGFHDWAGWDEEDPRNFGQADMVAALEWVQSNISQFGGDPKNVTLAGHSAGGMGVQLMLIDPRAQGTFARAWAHAGYGAWPFPKAYNPSPEERARIRYGALETNLSAKELVAQTPYFHLPFIDAPNLKQQPSAVWESGLNKEIPIVTGWNSYDGAGTTEEFIAKIDSPNLRTAYAQDFAVSDTQAAQRIFGDLRYGLSSWELSEYAKGWTFYYDAKQDGTPGASHGQHYASLFGRDKSDFRSALLNFIRTGSPGWEAGKIGRFSPNLNIRNQALSMAKREALSEVLETIK